MRKGFIITLSTILLSSFILLFAQFYSANVQSNESILLDSIKFSKSASVVDDISFDFRQHLGTGIDVNKGLSTITLHFTDSLPSDLNKPSLLDYQAFLYSAYSQKQNVSLMLDLNELIDGKTELLFSNGLQYDYSYAADSTVSLYAQNADTNAISYKITIYVNDDLNYTAPWAWDPNGDINVSLIYRDNSASINVSGKLNSLLNNEYRLNYSETAGDSIVINIGNIEGNKRAFSITESIDDQSSKANLELKAQLPSQTDNLFYYYNSDLNYSQADVTINSKIILGGD